MPCPEADEVAGDLLESLRSGCDPFQRLLDSLTLDCRTPTRRVIPRYVLVSLGDAIGRRVEGEGIRDLLPRIRGCWCELSEEARVIFAVVLSRLAMICPGEVFRSIRELKCGEILLARWVYPILGIWDLSYLDSLERRDLFLAAWAWYARYVPEDSELALDRIMERADVIDKPLITALKEVRKVIPSKVFERLQDKPELLKKVIP